MNGVRALGIRGCGVSMPLKETVIPFLDELDPVAQQIGAVNTVVNEDGRLVGHNTDWEGAVKALTEAYVFQNARVVMLGAGGVARAIGFGLRRAGVASLTVVNRTPARGRELAHHLGAEFRPLDELDSIEGELMINATSVGMSSDDERPVVRDEVLSRFGAVFDVVVSPAPTPTIEAAERLGIAAIPGLRMSLHQAAKQFELYTGRAAPLDAMERGIRAYLSGN